MHRAGKGEGWRGRAPAIFPGSPAPVGARSEVAKPSSDGTIVEPKRTTPISTSPAGPTRDADGKAKAASTIVLVKADDTLLKIAEQHRVSVSALMAANRLQSLKVTPGQQLVIPAR